MVFFADPVLFAALLLSLSSDRAIALAKFFD
jgi:hypothetical protein